MNHDEIYKLEVSMWEAAKARNSKAFLDVISDDVLFVSITNSSAPILKTTSSSPASYAISFKPIISYQKWV